MTEEVKKFVDCYNKRISWHEDILNSLDKDYLLSHEYTKNIVEECLNLEKIYPEDYDLDHVSGVYSYDDGTLEMEVFSNIIYHRVYFWTNPNKTEKEYKAERINMIIDKITNRSNEINNQLNTLQDELSQIEKFKNMF